MRKMGIIRPVDRNGRIVIPREIRQQLDIKNDIDELEIYVDGNKIVLRKINPYCIFCGEEDGNVMKMGGHMVCLKCIDKLSYMKGSLERR